MKYCSYIVLEFIMLFFIVSGAIAEQNANDTEYVLKSGVNKLTWADEPHTSPYLNIPQDQENGAPINITEMAKNRLTFEMIRLSWGILAFGVTLIVFIMIIVLKKNTGWNRELTRLFTVSMVIVAGLFLMTAGYDDRQVAPMFGLLGTLIGYIFGKSSPPEEKP